MRQRRRHEVAPLDAPVGRRRDTRVEIGDRDARRALKTDAPLARERHRVQLQRPDVRAAEHEREQIADFVIVYAHRDGGENRRRHVVLLEERERLELGFDGVRAQKNAIGLGPERVERENDARVERGEPAHVGFVAKLETVRRNRQTPDPRVAAHLQEVEELRVERRFAAGEIDDVDLVVILGEVPEDPGEILDRHLMGRVVLVDRVTDRTVEIAGRRNRDDGQIDLLLVRWTGAAVERTAVDDGLADPSRRRRGRDERERVEIPLHRRGDPPALVPVRRAELVEPHRIVLKDDLGIDSRLAGAAQTLRHRVVDVIGEWALGHFGWPLRRVSGSVSIRHRPARARSSDRGSNDSSRGPTRGTGRSGSNSPARARPR